MQKDSIYRNKNLWIACSAGLTVIMMAAVVVPSFPEIMAKYNVSEQEIGLVITALTIPLFVLGPVGGILADRLGRKRVFVVSLMCFGIFGGACAFAPDFKWILILRALQGIGSAPLGGLLPTVVSDQFTGNKRNEALGFNNTVNYVGYVIFPIVGGALAGLSWRYPFLIFLIAVPLAIIAMIFLKTPEPDQITSLREYFQGTLDYLKSWKVMWLFFSMVFTYIMLYGSILTYFTIFLGKRFQSDPIVLGSFVSVLGLMTAIASFMVGWLSKRFSSLTLVITGFILYAVSTAMIPLISNVWLCLVPIALFGIGHGLNLPSLTEIGSEVAPLEHRAGFMAIQMTMIPLGMTIGAPLMGFFYGVTGSLEMTFYIGGAIALIVPVLAVFVRKQNSDSITSY